MIINTPGKSSNHELFTWTSVRASSGGGRSSDKRLLMLTFRSLFCFSSCLPVFAQSTRAKLRLSAGRIVLSLLGEAAHVEGCEILGSRGIFEVLAAGSARCNHGLRMAGECDAT